MKHVLNILAFLFLTGCINKKIEITREYIVNENWNESANAIKINKMRLKNDSTLDIANLNQVDVVNRLEEDSSFIYVANVKIKSGEKYSGKRIYFGKDNGFYWWTDGGNNKTKILGDLEKGQWYKFSRLVTYPYYVYIYIDDLNNVHRQDVNLSNY